MGVDQSLLDEMDRIIDQYVKLHDELERVWSQKIVLTWHWWISLGLAVLPWALWLIVRDRKYTHSLLYAGLFTMLIATILDVIGVSQNAWNYDTSLLPYFPEYMPWDLSVMPVTAMLFYQFFPKVNPWLKGAVFGVVGAFIAEPIFAWLGFYEQANWAHVYSLPIYFAIYMMGYWLYIQNLRQTNRNGHNAALKN